MTIALWIFAGLGIGHVLSVLYRMGCPRFFRYVVMSYYPEHMGEKSFTLETHGDFPLMRVLRHHMDSDPEMIGCDIVRIFEIPRKDFKEHQKYLDSFDDHKKEESLAPVIKLVKEDK